MDKGLWYYVIFLLFRGDEKEFMAKKLRLEEYDLKCGACKKEYNLATLSKEAGRQNKRNLYCPHCGNRVGKLN